MRTLVHADPAEVHTRLAQLGLQLVHLHDAVLAGEVARNGCTDNDPRILRGILAWGRRMRSLRESLIPLGWRSDETDNYSTVENGTGSIAIATCTGDENTGLLSAIPRTKHRRGPVTGAVIEGNHQQLEFELFQKTVAAIQARPACSTWILLVARTSNELQCELSLPIGQGSNDRIEHWMERILLPSLPLAPVALPVPAPQPDIDVTVTRKVG